MTDAPTPEDPPCSCIAATHPEFGDGHSKAQHEADSCFGWPPCGGCYDCLAKQASR